MRLSFVVYFRVFPDTTPIPLRYHSEPLPKEYAFILLG